jgi:septum formation protein
LIYLASRSPRRRELLAQIGVRFEPLLFRTGARADPDTDETALPGEPADEYVRRVTRMKANAAWARVTQRRGLQRKPVLAADTTVAVDDQIFGKPVDLADARRMLAALSGRRHRVLTAVALQQDHRFEIALSESFVTFAPLGGERIEAYIATGEALDKAGAYGIQGRAGAFVLRLEGSYTGVMGLPLYETAELLRLFGVMAP